jgi:hypothetical protein
MAVISPEYDKARCIFDPYAVAKLDHFFSARLRRSDRPLAFAWFGMERDAVSRWRFVVPYHTYSVSGPEMSAQ